MSIRRVAPAAAVLLMLALGGARSAWADIVLFDPNGAGVGQQILSFDPAPGNAVAVGGGAAPPQQNVPFQIFYQATLPTFLDSNGNTVFAPAGTQFTVIVGFQEQIVNPQPDASGLLQFGFVPGGINYVGIYANTTGTNLADNSAGTGFNTGTLILQGTVSGVGASSAFNIDPASIGSPVQFDQTGTPESPKFVGQQSIQGSGTTVVQAVVNSVDSNYFIQPPTLLTLSFNTSTVLPFGQVKPSELFAGSLNPADPLVNPTLGAINGISGPDVQFQADSNFSFTVAAVPEPTSVALMSIGLISGLGILSLRRRRTA